MSISKKEALERLSKLDGDELCKYCKYSTDCSGGVTGGPNGPVFPPCADGDMESIINIDGYIENGEEENQ